MCTNRVHILLVLATIIVLCHSAGGANEVSWIQGQSCPPDWSIVPAQPDDAEVIEFSGPVRFYINRCVAEDALGGRPVLYADHVNKTVEIRFDPPASTDCTGFWNPVCGLRGSFGPLETGVWRFFCSVEGAAFSLDFSVGGGSPEPEAVIYVDATAPTDPNAPEMNDGSSWQKACVSLQDALRAVAEGTEIRVARGKYWPDQGAAVNSGDRDATFRLKNGVVLKGGYAGLRGVNPNERQLFVYETVLSGDLAEDDVPVARPSQLIGTYMRADNSRHVVTLSGTDATAVLDGFTITGGTADGDETQEQQCSGGAIYAEQGGGTIHDCLIVNNGARYYGGGLYTRGRCSITFTGCTMANNWANRNGGAVYYQGSSTLVMDRCLLTSNAAQYQGGALCGCGNGHLTLSNSVISGNRAMEPEYGRGGALYGWVTRANVNQCTFVGNRAAVGWTVATSPYNPPQSTEIRLSNCILWCDGDAVVNDDGSLLEITYSDVYGGWPGQGNIDTDPCFVQMGFWDPLETTSDLSDDLWIDGDYHLRWDSPCVDTGSLEAVWDPNGRDMGGLPRISGLTADMGAYELRNDPPVADAGPDVAGFTIDGTRGAVTFDGSRSYDPEGMPLSYRWYYGSELVSEQVRFTMDLPVGEHILKLVVADTTGVTGFDEVKARVTIVVGTKAFVSPRVVQRDGNQDIVALVVLPKGKQPSDFNPNEPLLLFPGGVRASKQSVFVWLSGDTLALGTFKHADVMAAIPADGSVELNIVGGLTDGQYFCGTDTATIQ